MSQARRSLRWIIETVNGCRDLMIVTAGAIMLIWDTAPSVVELGFRGPAAVVWALFLLGGAGVSLIGVIRRYDDLQLYGGMVSGAGFAIWTVAAVLSPDKTSTTYAIACVLAGGVIGQVHRALLALERSLP